MDPVPVLQRLLQFDTVNPPGAERPAQEYLAGLLRDARASRSRSPARTRSGRTWSRGCAGARPARCSGCSRTSTRSASRTRTAWRHGPWSGALADGCVWGRGALDMKSQTAAEVAAACSLARLRLAAGRRRPARDQRDGRGGRRLGRDLALRGAARPRALRLPAQRGRRARSPSCRRPPLRRSRSARRASSASRSSPTARPATRRCRTSPTTRCSSSRRCSSGWRRARRAGTSPPGPPRCSRSSGIAARRRPGARRSRSSRARAPDLAPLVEPMLRVTLAPTMVSASRDYNVIPAEARLDGRLPRAARAWTRRPCSRACAR